MNVQGIYWQAGIFEGEGSVSISKPNKRNQSFMTVNITNTDLDLLKPFHRMWGGAIRRAQHYHGRRQAWRWVVCARKAEAFLMCMWPCLQSRARRFRVDVALVFQAQKRPPGRSRWLSRAERQRYLRTQRGFYERLRALNVRGAK